MNKEEFKDKLKYTKVERELMQAFEDNQNIADHEKSPSETLRQCRKLGLTDAEIIDNLRLDPKHRDNL